MEILVNRMIDFDSNINAFDNPPLLSQVYRYQAYSFWKWGALLLALIASFTTIINRLRILIIRLQKHPSPPSQQNHRLPHHSTYGTDTDTSCSSSDCEDQEEEEEEEEEEATTVSSSNTNWQQVDEDFRVRGSNQLHIHDQCNTGLRRRRRRSIGDLFSCSDLTAGKSVVKLWDNLGLGLGLNVDTSSGDSANMLTVCDVNNQREIQKIASFFRQQFEIPTVVAFSSSSSPALIFSAAKNDGGAVALGSWDRRIGSRIPAILAEWRPKLGNIIGVKAGGVEKLYVRDNVSSALTAGDMRKVNSPLEDLTENDVDTWWDADAVIVTEETFQDSS